MMRNIFKLVLFTFMLNIATGIMSVAITDIAGNQVFQSEDMARVPVYDSAGTAKLTGSYNVANGTFSEQDQTINPGGIADTSGNIVFRLLDLIGLGFINNILKTIDYYLFGFVNFMHNMFGQYMNTALHDLLFPTDYFPGILKTLIMIGYAFAAFELWTNKTLVD